MRSLVIALSLIAFTSAYNQLCTPGTHFTFNCNTCVCSTEGRSVCTTKPCQPGSYNHGNSIDNRSNYVHQTIPASQNFPITPSYQLGRNPSTPRQVCTPNAFHYIDCNHCWCSVSGQTYTCTKLSCGATQTKPNIPSHNQYPQPTGPKYSVPNIPHQQYPQQIQPNYSIQNNVNQQYPYPKVPNQPALNNLNQQRPYVNIPNYPAVNVPNYPPKLPNPYPSFSGSNQNIQHQNSQSVFPAPNAFNQQYPTQKVPGSHHKHQHGCGHRHKRDAEHTLENSKKVCKAGTKFKEYCNDCICSADGTRYACTKKTCNSTVYNRNGTFVKPYVCEPNTIFHHYCNICVCPETGSEVVCTAEACKDDTYENETFKNPKADVYENGKTCTSSHIFYSGCNQCICREDGISAYCTLESC